MVAFYISTVLLITGLVNGSFFAGKSSGTFSNGPSSSNGPQSNQILCCAYNANGTAFVTGSSDTYARVCLNAFSLEITS
jgi:hypothetical protein